MSERDLSAPTQAVLYAVLSSEDPQGGIVLKVAPILPEGGSLGEPLDIIAKVSQECLGESLEIFGQIALSNDPYVWVRQVGESENGVPICVVADHNIWDEILRQVIEKVRAPEDSGPKRKMFVRGFLLGIVCGFILRSFIRR